MKNKKKSFACSLGELITVKLSTSFRDYAKQIELKMLKSSQKESERAKSSVNEHLCGRTQAKGGRVAKLMNSMPFAWP